MVSDLEISKTTAEVVNKTGAAIERFTEDVEAMPREKQLGLKKGLQAAISDRSEKILHLKWRRGTPLSESQMDTIGKPLSEATVEYIPKFSQKEKKVVDVPRYFNPFGLDRLDVHSIAAQRAIPAEHSDLARATEQIARAKDVRALAEKTLAELESGGTESTPEQLATAIQAKRDAVANYDALLRENGVDPQKVVTLNEVGQALLTVMKLKNKEKTEKHNAHIHLNRSKIAVITHVMARDDRVDAEAKLREKFEEPDIALIAGLGVETPEEPEEPAKEE